MNVTITISGDTADTALAAVLSVLAAGNAQVAIQQFDTLGTTSTAPSSPASPPMPSVPTVTADDDDDGGPTVDAATDSNGLPWDERIHSGARSQNKDGTWKRKKGVSAEAAAPIEAELRQSMQPAPATPLPVPPTAPVSAPPAMPSVPAMPAPAAPVPPMPAATAPAEQPSMTFAEFMNRLSPIMATKPEVDVVYLTDLAKRFGMSQIADLHVKPEMVGIVVATMQSEGKWL